MKDAPGDVEVLPDADALAVVAAERLIGWVSDALRRQDTAHVALTGGSSATGLYRALRDLPPGVLDWSRVHLWWGDDRFVPLDHPDSNAGAAYGQLLGVGAVADSGLGDQPGVPVPAANVHPIAADEALSSGGDPGIAASRYAEEIRRLVPSDTNGVPVFDVILLGMGPDGHILSVFPGSDALAPGVPTVMPIPAPTHVEPHVARVTLTPGVLGAARHVLVMVPGAGKAEMVRNVLEGERDPVRWPATLAVLPRATWLLDKASAAQLARRSA